MRRRPLPPGTHPARFRHVRFAVAHRLRHAERAVSGQRVIEQFWRQDRSSIYRLCISLALVASVGAAFAQPYLPDRPIRIVTATPAAAATSPHKTRRSRSARPDGHRRQPAEPLHRPYSRKPPDGYTPWSAARRYTPILRRNYDLFKFHARLAAERSPNVLRSIRRPRSARCRS
jgi:hypothetical protein